MYIVTGKNVHWVQMQLEDSSGKYKVKFIDLRYKRGRILFNEIFHRDKSTQVHPGKIEVKGNPQTNLEDYGWIISKKRKGSGSSSFRLPYRRQVRQVSPEEYMEGKLTWAEIEALQHYSTANGYLKDLFLLNDFENRYIPALANNPAKPLRGLLFFFVFDRVAPPSYTVVETGLSCLEETVMVVFLVWLSCLEWFSVNVFLVLENIPEIDF